MKRKLQILGVVSLLALAIVASGCLGGKNNKAMMQDTLDKLCENLVEEDTGGIMDLFALSEDSSSYTKVKSTFEQAWSQINYTSCNAEVVNFTISESGENANVTANQTIEVSYAYGGEETTSKQSRMQEIPMKYVEGTWKMEANIMGE